MTEGLRDYDFHLQWRAKRLNHIHSSFLAQEDDTRNVETIPGPLHAEHTRVNLESTLS